MSSFLRTQQDFCQHIRDPEHHPYPEEIEDRRLKIYRDLFFNNVNGFVSSAFPVLKSLYSEQSWLQLVREFFCKHDCHSPIFLEISREFLDFLQREHQATEDDHAFLLELAHYEWVELDVSIREEVHQYPRIAEDDLLPNTRLVLSECAWPLSYQYPVHHISSDFIPESAPEQPTFLLVYRDLEDEVQFMELNAASAKLLQLLVEMPGVIAEDLAEQMVPMMPQLPPEQVRQGMATLLQGLCRRGVIRQFKS